MDSGPRLRRLLQDAAKLVGQPDVLLQVRTNLLEVVYVERDADGLLVHDHGTTHDYLSIATDEGYLPWSADIAAAVCDRYRVQLATQRFAGSQVVRVQRRIAPQDDAAAAVQAVAAAVEETYRRHRRAVPGDRPR